MTACGACCSCVCYGGCLCPLLCPGGKGFPMLLRVPDAENLVFPAGGCLLYIKGVGAQKVLGRLHVLGAFFAWKKRACRVSRCFPAFHPAGGGVVSVSCCLLRITGGEGPAGAAALRVRVRVRVRCCCSPALLLSCSPADAVQVLRALRGARCLSVCLSVLPSSCPPVVLPCLLVLPGVDALGV